MEGLTEGRTVHYVLPDGPHAGEHRAAVVVKVWPYGVVNLKVLLDGSNDDPAGRTQPHWTEWQTSVPHDGEGKQPRSWHWIERA